MAVVTAMISTIMTMATTPPMMATVLSAKEDELAGVATAAADCSGQ